MEPTVEVDIEEVEEVGRGSESIGEGRAVKAASLIQGASLCAVVLFPFMMSEKGAFKK